MELQGKVAVVTGGGSGIGAACCRAFAAEGARVAVVDRVADGATAVASGLDGLAVVADIGSEGAVDDLVARVEAELGPIDVFFNNAGIATGGDPIETPLADWQEQWEINLMSHVYAVRAVLPKMLERGSGHLLHTASMAGILTSQGNCTYAVTKHAVVGWPSGWPSPITTRASGCRCWRRWGCAPRCSAIPPPASWARPWAR